MSKKRANGILFIGSGNVDPVRLLFCGDLTILLVGLGFYCFLFRNIEKLRHSLGRPSRSDLVQLKKYSDKKMEEAKKEVYDEAGKILLPDYLKKYLKATSKSKLYKTIAKKSPEIAEIIKKGITSIEKFNAVKKGLEGLKSIDIKNTSEDKIVKKFAEYDKKVLAYQKAIENLF